MRLIRLDSRRESSKSLRSDGFPLALANCQPNPVLSLRRDLIALLHLRDVDVYLVSGGFKSLIEPVAKELNIPIENVFANRLKFYFDGYVFAFEWLRIARPPEQFSCDGRCSVAIGFFDHILGRDGESKTKNICTQIQSINVENVVTMTSTFRLTAFKFSAI